MDTIVISNIVQGELNNDQTVVRYLFIPEITGSYELVCRANNFLNGAIYNENGIDIVNSTYVNYVKHIRLATTLIKNQKYLINIEMPLNCFERTEYKLYIKIMEEPKSLYFRYQWGLLNKEYGFDINILPVWQYTKGKSVKIGIVDTGTNYTHINLKDSINIELSYNFVHDMKDIYPDNEMIVKSAAKNEHGTHIAGIIGAKHCDALGIAGIAPLSSIISLKIIGSRIKNWSVYNEASESFIKVIEYAKKNDIKILNCSFSGVNPSEQERMAMQNAKEILFIIAAGNNGANLESNPIYPACYYIENSIVVGAADFHGELYETSNYGGPTDILAPGRRIISTYKNNDYIYSNATSIATSFVTAVCGLIWSLDQNLTPLQVKRRILSKNNVTSINSLKDKVKSGGMLNAYKAVLNNDID